MGQGPLLAVGLGGPSSDPAVAGTELCQPGSWHPAPAGSSAPPKFQRDSSEHSNSTWERSGEQWEFTDTQGLGVLNKGVGSRLPGDKGPAKPGCGIPYCSPFSEDRSLFQRCCLQDVAVPAPGAGLVVPGRKSSPLPREKAAGVPVALPPWLNCPVSSWCSKTALGSSLGTQIWHRIVELKGITECSSQPHTGHPKSQPEPEILFAMTSMSPWLVGNDLKMSSEVLLTSQREGSAPAWSYPRVRGGRDGVKAPVGQTPQG